MKKRAYTKPALLVEHFSLTQALTSCAVMIGFQDPVCVFLDTDSTPDLKDLAMIGYFADSNCTKFINGTEKEDQLCYHTSTNMIFSS